ncbi:MAG: WD40/YVTN/BNR-like repeat-containing protein [Saprospiraceae bacterium]
MLRHNYLFLRPSLGEGALFILLFFSAFTLKINGQNRPSFTPEVLKTIKVRNIGPGAMSGRITSIAVDPNHPEVIYAGAASGGVWRSKSGGTAWEPIFDNAPTQGVGSIAINPRNPDEIWVGTGEGNPRNSQNFGIGIFKTINGGKDWVCMGLQNTRTIHRVVLHRDNPDIVFAASLGSTYGPTEERGVFKSTDGGKTWKKTLYVNDITGCADLVADPQNPNKLYAAMWEYRRWPWFFKSGGKGSGLYVSYDAGETWEKRTDKDGLPEGDLGRIGLAVAKSNPDIVYALVEAKENALYKSTDGGKKWQKMADKGQGDRPFYYSEIYVDPKNENRVYSIYTLISKSEDGGKTFSTWAGWHIHPDHHAFWISPDNPNYIINGNDGGLNITYDGGKTWRYAENIPVGQFYHVETDNEWPYNVYGGLQDNGSWVGPSAVWKSGGIRNSDWQEVAFGDGFETMPQKDDSRYVFAQSQGGELGLVDRKTGENKYIKPLHPDGETKLRFNWNAALAQDPWQDKGIFFGSQFLHHSYDLGQTWRIISPDLTTNDTSKLHQDISGGLTFDATNAENHCTIIAIAPSPVQKGVAWVGTDDGNVQLTTDHGKTWANFAKDLPDAPKNAWIPAIEASPINAGEAFVVLNNYRQNDWQPYLYHTTDFGKKWKRLASAKNLPVGNGAQGGNYCLSVVQDPEVSNLIFLGTEHGLYVSINYGENWVLFPGESFPRVPIFDLKIQQRDADLVLGTFGRGIWILDNLSVLRELARSGANLLDQPFKLFPAQPGVLAEFRSFDGPRFAVDATYEGENKGTAVSIPVWVKPGIKKMEKAKGKSASDKGDDKDKPASDKAAAGKLEEKKEDKKEGDKPASAKATDKPASAKATAGKKEKATIMVFSMNGDTLRRFKTELDSTFSSRIWWGKDTKGVRFPSKNEPGPDQMEPGNGPQVLPGEYWVKAEYMGYRDSILVKVIDDPRLNISVAEREAKNAAKHDLYNIVERATKAYNRLKEAEKTIGLVESQFVNVPDSLKKDVNKLGSTIKDSVSVLKDKFFQHKEAKGIQRNPDVLNAKFWNAIGYIDGGQGAPNAATQTAISTAKREAESLIEKVNMLLDTQWKEYREKVEGVKFSVFKDFDKI